MIETSALDELLELYASTGVKATWFWRLSTGNRDQVRRVLDAGHEVALHTEVSTRKRFKSVELRYFNSKLDVAPSGYSAHGGRGSVGYLGLTQLEWAIEEGLSYGEMLGGASELPYPAMVIRDGVPSVAELVLPAQHHSLDSGTKPTQHCYEELLEAAQRVLSQGKHCVVMNHPDIHRDELKRLIGRLDLSRTWKASLAEICTWFRDTKMETEWKGSGRAGCLRFRKPLKRPLRVFAETDTRRVVLQLSTGADALVIPC